MSSDETSNAPEQREQAETPAATDAREPLSRRDALREKAKQVTAKQARTRVLWRVGAGIATVGVLAAVGISITNTVVPEVTEETQVPDGFVDGGFTVEGQDLASMLGTGTATPPPTPTAIEEPDPEETPATEPVPIQVYVDYLSEPAGEFQAANASRLAHWVQEGDVTLTYHPVAMLTSKSSGTKYSQRAVAAVACVATHSPHAVAAFNHSLLTDQPEVDTEGYTDAELADRAIAAGAENTAAVRSCIEDGDYTSWARETTNAALDGALPGTEDVSLSGTPLVLVGGQAYVGALDDPEEFTQFVLTVESDTYFQSTPTPTPTPTSTPAG